MRLFLFNDDLIGIYIALAIAAFIAAVFIIRWIFGIAKIIELLEVQNKHNLTQIRLMKKMLLEKGVPDNEIDYIINYGNKRNE